MLTARITCIAVLVAASSVAADPIADMAGTWRGSGWARETPTGPQEAVRCQISNSYDAASLTLTMTGRCAVPGRELGMSGSLVGTAGTNQIAGRWTNPDGIGSTTIVGLQRDGVVAFTFVAQDPVTGRDLAQNVEWRVTGPNLHLRSTDRARPDIMMSDIMFDR